MTQYSYYQCPVCTVHYAVDATFMKYRRDAPKNDPDRSWRCPNGHTLVFTTSRHEREKERRVAAEKRVRELRDRLDTEQRRTAAYKGHFKRVSNNVREGVCPACSKTFPALEEHMRDAHPDWDPELGPQESEEKTEKGKKGGEGFGAE